MAIEHMLDVVARLALVSQIVQRRADHPVANEKICRI